MVWARPFVFKDSSRCLQIGLQSARSGEVAYRITSTAKDSHDEPILHSQGTALLDEVRAEDAGDLDLAALTIVDAEEMRRLDARRVESRLYVSLLEVPTPKRAPRAAAHRKPALSKTRSVCRNRIWRCGPPISPVAQGSVQRLRSRSN